MANAARARRSPRLLRVLGAAGVLAAAVLAVNVNLLAAHWYRRWDLSQDALYTLSEPSRAVLRSLTAPVEISVLLTRGDPLATTLRQVLAVYTAEGRQLTTRFVDPERDPAAFLALQQKYGIAAGRSEDGRLLTDASVVIAAGDRHWYVTSDELLRFDPESGRALPRLEQALTEGIAQVTQGEKAVVCFSRGHDEIGLYDAGPEGLAELRSRIEKSNYSVEERDLPAAGGAAPFRGCRVLVVAGPDLPFAPADAEALISAVRSGTGALLLLAPLLGEDHHVEPSGLEPLAALAGIELGQDLVLEREPTARLPRGAGELFFAQPQTHDITRGILQDGGRLAFRVLMGESRTLRLFDPSTRPLLETSKEALAVADLSPLLSGGVDDAQGRAGPHVLAAARELAAAPGKSERPRLVVVGSASPAWSRSFRDAALYGDQLFVENAVAWLSARATLLSVPEKRGYEVGLALSEEALGEVLRYVLVYMPASAALLGALVLLRRRAQEKRSRRPGSADDGHAART